MLSNRESARRSRKRKQEQLVDLEKQIQAMEDKNAHLERQCNAAAVTVRDLMADKQRLENENQHMMGIFQQLQVRHRSRGVPHRAGTLARWRRGLLCGCALARPPDELPMSRLDRRAAASLCGIRCKAASALLGDAFPSKAGDSCVHAVHGAGKMARARRVADRTSLTMITPCEDCAT
jgi:bZIP transcription factor